ncbi:MAG: hypothetical protein RLY84_399 [Actinomycetota bacterium]
MQVESRDFEVLDKGRGILAGLAIGDAFGRPVEGLTREAIRELYGNVNNFLTTKPAGSDDTEYAVLTASVLIEHGLDSTSEDFANYWISNVCSQSGAFAGAGFSEMLAIENLRRGLRPPESGKHIHSWSDGLAMRVAPIAIASRGDLETAKRLTIADGEVSHSGEGIYSGIVAAVAATATLQEISAIEVFTAAQNSIPKESWTYRALQDVWLAFKNRRDENLSAFADELLEIIPTHHYVFADFGPEATALALGSVLAGAGDFVETIRFAVNLGRDADTIAAIAGSIAGGLAGFTAIPTDWKLALTPLEGSCLEFTKGVQPMDLVESLVNL